MARFESTRPIIFVFRKLFFHLLWTTCMSVPTLLVVVVVVFIRPDSVHSKQVISMGDVHGDDRVFSQLLHHLNLTSEIGGEIEFKQNDLLFIQTGDVLDRGPDGLKILKFLMKAIDKSNDRVDFLLG